MSPSPENDQNVRARVTPEQDAALKKLKDECLPIQQHDFIGSDFGTEHEVCIELHLRLERIEAFAKDQIDGDGRFDALWSEVIRLAKGRH